MNQFRGYCLLTNALFVAINMSCKLNEKPRMNHFLDNSMEEHVVVAIELDLLIQTSKERFVIFWMLLFLFLRSLMKEKFIIRLH
jgi:hypothetical protein